MQDRAGDRFTEPPMNFRIQEESLDVLPEYGQVPIALEVKSRFRVELVANVPACRFYARMGAKLGQVHLYAYRTESLDEVQLTWYKEL